MDYSAPNKFRFLMLSLVLSFAILVLDQNTKHLVRFFFSLGESKTIIPSLFNLTYVRNTGAVWGWLQHQNEWLALISLVVLTLMAFFYHHLVDGRWIYSVAIGCIAGGILGNLVDRIKFGWVTDFLDFYWNNNHWPSFNVADSAICIGVGCYLLASLWPAFQSRPGKPNPVDPSSPENPVACHREE